MAKKKRSAYDDLQESLGLAKYTDKQLNQLNLESAKANARKNTNRSSNAIAPINNTQDTARKILTPGVAPIKLNTSGGLSEYQEAQKKQEESIKATKKAEELRKQVAKEKMEQGILSQTQMFEQSFSDQFQNKMSDKIKLPTQKSETSLLNKKPGETNIQAIIRAQKENAEKEKLYNKTSYKYKQLKQNEKIAEQNKMKVFKDYKDDDDKMYNEILKQVVPQYEGMSKKQLLKEREKLREQYWKASKKDKKNTRKWWYENYSTAENIGNVLYKMFGNGDPTDESAETTEVRAREDAVQKALDNVNTKNKKFDKSVAGKSEKLSLSIASGFEKGTKGIETTVRKILRADTKEDIDNTRETIKTLGGNQSYIQQLSNKAIQETNSKFGRAVLEIGQSTGQMLPQMFVPGSKLSTVIGFANYGGSSYNDAINDGYTEEQATKYGVVNGTLEMALNKVLPSFKINGKNIYGKTVSDKLSSKIMSKVVGNSAIKSAIMDATGEFTEEYLQEFLDPIVRETLLEENNGAGIKNAKDLNDAVKGISKYTAKNFFSKENLRAGILGFATSGMLGATNTYNSYKYEKQTGRNAETNLTQNEQAVVDNIVENRKQQLKEQNGKVTKKEISKIEQEVKQDLQRGYIDTNDIERALSNEAWNRNNEVVTQKENLEKQIKELESKTPNDFKTMGDLNASNEQLSKLKEQLNNLDTITTRNELNSSMLEKISDNDTLLQNAYGKAYNRNEKFETTAKNHNIDTNDETIKTIKDKMFKRGIEISFDDKSFSNTKEDALWRQNKDGTREVIFNPKADTGMLLQNVAVHEMYHDVFNSKTGQKLNKEVLDYVKSKNGYEEARKELEQVYAKDYDDANSDEFIKKIDEEVVAKTLGQKLGDQEYINSLTMEKPNTARAIYNWVVDKLNKFTGSKNEKLFWTDVKNKFETALSEDYVARDNVTESRLSTIGIKGAKNLAKNSDIREYKQLSLNQKIAEDIHKNSKSSLGETNIKSKSETGWFKTKYGDWGTLISDKDAKLTKKLEPNKEYRLGDIFEHKELYKAYPKLKNLKVITQEFDGKQKTSFGAYSPNLLSKGIYLNNFWIENQADYKGTLLHEINHYIQGYEKYNKNSRGATFEEINRNNNLGEIISNTSKIYSDFTQEELNDIILPELAKSNPKFKNIEKQLKALNKRDFYDKLNKIVDRGIYDYETNEYTRQNKSKTQDKKIQETDEKRETDSLIFDAEELDNSSFSLDKLPKVKDGYTRLYRGLNNDYDANYDRTTLDSPNGYDTLTDNYELAKQYGKNVYYIDIPTNQIADSVIDENPNSETYGDRNLAYKDDKPAGLNGVSGDEYLLYTDHDDFDSNNYHKVEDSNTNNSISNKDSQGRTLTKEQQEYFKDSKIRNDKGELLEVYHGTNSEFTIFDKNKLGSGSGDLGFLGDGFYFATHKGEAKYYGSNVVTSYLNIKNPYNIQQLSYIDDKPTRNEAGSEYVEIANLVKLNPEWSSIKINNSTYGKIAKEFENIKNNISVKFINSDGNVNFYEVYNGDNMSVKQTTLDYKTEDVLADSIYDELRQKFGFINSNDVLQNISEESRFDNQKSFSQVLQEKGYDGVIQGEKASYTDEIVVFNPNQIKNVDNTNPTTNEDIRKSTTTDKFQAFLDKHIERGTGKTIRDVTKQQEKAVKQAIAPLNKEIKALKKEVADLKKETTYNDFDNYDGDLADYVPVDATMFHGEKISDLRNFVKNKYLGWGEKAGVKDKLASVRNELNFNDSLTSEQRKQLNTEEAQLSFALNYPNYRERLAKYESHQKKQIAPIEKAKENPNEYKPYLEMSREINPDETNSEVVNLLNEVDSKNNNSEVKTKPRKQGKLSDAKRTAQYLFSNRNVEIDEYARETGNKNIKLLADHVNNIQGEITTNINNAQLDNFGNTIGKGITQIYDQARAENLSEAFDDYLFNKSNMARHLQGKGSVVDYNESEQLVKAYEKEYPQMKEWANEVNNYNTNLLYKQADAGLITKDLADNLTKMYDFYVPFMENIDSEFTPNETGQIKTRSTVKSARGGADKNLLGFEEAMMRQTQSAITQIRKNQLYQEIVNTKANRSIDFEDNTNPNNFDSGLQEMGGKYYLTAYVDGKAVQTEIDKNLYHGLNQAGDKKIKQYEKKFSAITKPLQYASNIRRNILTTWSPTFIITNPLKDLQDAPLNSKYAKDMAKNVPRAFKELATGKGTELDAFLNMYGQAHLRGDYNIDSGLADVTKLAKTNKKANTDTDNGALQISKNMLKKIPQLNEIIEMAPRYAEYLASIENGCSQMEALYNAREVTTNFGRGGIITKALNRNGFTFMNASVQGFSKLVRNFSGENGTKAVLSCVAKASALGLAPALINALLLGDDDDYEAIPDYIKDNYYLFKTSDNNFIRIPKGRMMSIFGSAGRRALERANGKRDELSLKEDISSYFSNAYNQVGVQNPAESNIFAPIYQAKNNKTWYGTDLVPKRLQTDKDGNKIPAKDQYDASTDKMSIWLGKVTGISPYKINYVVDQYSGGIGDMILPTITEEAQSKSNSVVGKALAPLKDKFTADSITDNKNVTNFYSKVESLGAKKNETGSKKDEMSYQYMRNLSFEMGSLYKEMREVQADKTLSNSKKYAKVQNIKAEINKIAEEGMRGYKDVESYENYARVGNREMYKYQSRNGKTGWSLSDSKYADDINTLGLSVKEKNDYYTIKMKMSDTASKYGEGEGSQRFRAVLKTIRKANLPSDAKYELYNSWYGKNNKISKVAQDVGIDADTYLDYQTADLSADKNRKGYSIRGSKANKVIRYLNKTNLDYGQKAILYRASFGYKGSYSSSSYSNAYNNTIINYLNTLDTTYEEDVDICKRLGFKVSKNGDIRW